MNSFILAICIVVCQLVTYKCDAASTSNGVVEIYVAIDKKAVDGYIYQGSTPADAILNAQRDAEYYLTEINKIIQSAGVNIGLSVRRMDILGEDVFDDCQLLDGVLIHEHLGLSLFYRHLKKKDLFNSLKYDMALLWTGYNIFGRQNVTAGYATIGTMCSETAVAIVEFDNTYRTVHMTAHNIGYVLGLHDDQQGACDDGYVMANPIDTSSTRRWRFSPCSVASLFHRIPMIPCLRHTSPESQVPGEKPRDALLDADKMCRWARNNTDSFMCRVNKMYNDAPPQGDVVCERLYCHVTGTNNCTSAYPPNGLVCGVNERCLDGHCVAAPDDFPTPPGLHADCLFGDYSDVIIDGVETTCSEFFEPEGRRRQCYSPTIAVVCCGTCHSLKGNIPGCPYGDLSSQCVNYSQDAVCPDFKDSLCCEHCSGWRPKRRAGRRLAHPVLEAVKLAEVSTLEVIQADDNSTTIV